MSTKKTFRFVALHAPADDKLVEEFRKQVAPLMRSTGATIWDANQIRAGSHTKAVINAEIDGAGGFLLLVSAHFLAGGVEEDVMERVWNRVAAGVPCIPIIVKPCFWTSDPRLARLHPAPHDGKAVTLWSNRDEAWLDVVTQIQATMKEQPGSDSLVKKNETPAAGASIGWLHLSDLHQGMDGQSILWPRVRKAFFDDLDWLHKKSGPWDMVLFTGDLTQRGSATEFDELTKTLDKLWDHIARLQPGIEPALLAVPGNHDLERPAKSPAVKVLAHWHTDRETRDELFSVPGSEYRKVVDRAFSAYVAWLARFQAAHPGRVRIATRAGLLPGDFAATVEKDGFKLGVVGLNSAFLQLASGDYHGRLDLDLRQLAASCGDPVEWAESHQAALFLSHHPPDWLEKSALVRFYSELCTPDHFAAHLFGHMHEATTSFISLGGGPVRRQIQSPSLFGMEKWGEAGEDRRHGYSAGRIALERRDITLRIWPRRMDRQQSGIPHLVGDTSFALDRDDQSISTTWPLRR